MSDEHWIQGRRLGKGGNGEVFQVERHGVVGALKRLSQRGQLRVARFRDEVEAMRRCADIPGVLPVLDADLGSDTPWFVMALATPIEKALAEAKSLRQVVEAVGAIATTLAAMHARGFSHRDVKPDNLFFYEGRWAVGDFGLVSFEGKTAETQRGEKIGPTFFMAPEMLNEALHADGRRADVFSLAKTLWVLATGQRYPLPGAYDPTQESMRIGTYVAEERTGPLDKLIAGSTVFSPELRPSMETFALDLAAWLAPRLQPKSPLALNSMPFAAELERRRLASEAQREKQRLQDEASSQAGHRLRECFRPLAKELEEALKTANLDSVSLEIDQFQWGFQAEGYIPEAGGGQSALLRVSVGFHSSQPTAQAWCMFVLRRHTPIVFGTLLWDKSISFFEGGSDEEIQLERLKCDIRREFPVAVHAALSMVLGRPEEILESKSYQFRVNSSEGVPIPGVEILLVGANGVFMRSTTDSAGNAVFGPTLLDNIAAFVAHTEYRGEVVSNVQADCSVSLVKESCIGSMVCTNGWTQVNGLLGQISVIHDEQHRTYLYARNVAIDDGAAQPVNIALGRQTSLRGADGIAVSITAKAVRGPCFLFDVRREDATF